MKATPLIAAAAYFLFTTPAPLHAAQKKNVVLIAGKPSHGRGAHEHNAGVQLFAKCLKEGAAELVDTTYHLNAEWPSADDINKADTILIYADGFTGHPALQANRLDQLRAATGRGCGFVAIHWATEVPADHGGAEFLEWMGGYCEPFWSVNPHWTADFQSLPHHPVTSGVKPFSTLDEWYFHMRFRPGMVGVTPVLTAIAPEVTVQRPDGMRSGNAAVRKAVADKTPQHVAWAAERPEGGRGFGFTGGHFHKGWANDHQRKLILNAILWTAKATVPADGVQSTVNASDMEANLDPKSPPPPPAANPASSTAIPNKEAPATPSAGPQRNPGDPNPLLSPKEAMEKMTLPKGFHVDLVAAEPALVQPIAFCWDERGRLWVVEGNTYPTRRGNPPAARPDDDPKLDQLTKEESSSLFGGQDRILIFSDEDGDGSYETRKVFLENLNLVSGIEVGYGGVYLGAAPFFLHIPLDPSGDKPAGPPRVLADGFGWQDTHETLNSFVWGPDGWLYGCHGVFTQSKVRNRTPAAAAASRDRVPMNCAYWRWHPVNDRFEVFAHGTSNPWGLDFNSRGQFFSEACVIPHFWHVIQGAYYLRQSNPLGHFNPFVYKNIETIADHAHFVGRQSDRTSSDEAGGGHAHCGLAFYNGTLFPPEYRDRPYFGNIHGKRINSERLVPEGSGFRASHAPDFLRSNDFNFTAVTLKTGPDGSLVVSDWYDRQKCHSNQVQLWDRSNGRLYRIRTADWKPWKADPALWEPASTLDLQLQENGWLSRMARRQIGEYGAAHTVDDALIEKATRLLKAPATPTEARLRVMWWLHATRNKGNAMRWLQQLQDPEPHIRLWAIQLAMEQGPPSSEFVAAMKGLCTSDPSPVVRLALCSALQRMPHNQRWDLLEALLQHSEDEKDRNLPQMLWYAIEPMVPDHPARALKLARASKLTLPSALIARRVAEMRSPESLPLLLQVARDSTTPEAAAQVLEAVLESLRGRSHQAAPALWKSLYEHTTSLLKDHEKNPVAMALMDARDALGALFDDARALENLRRTSRSSAEPAGRRLSALRALTASGDPHLAETLAILAQEPATRLDALRSASALRAGEFEPGSHGAALFRSLFERFATLTSDEKGALVLALSGRAEGARMLLDAVAAKQILRSDISVFAARQIAGLNVAALNDQLEKLWGVVRLADKDANAKGAEQEHARLKALLSNQFLNQADLKAGRVLFQSICGACHQLFGEGGHIGPDLTGSNRANLDYILENVTNPNAVIGKDYELHVWTLTDGRTISGMVRREDDGTITVQTPSGEERVPKSLVQRVERPGISMMPAGLFSALPKEQVRDLVAYLRSGPQVASAEDRNPQTFSVPGVLEGETLKILTSGFPVGMQRMKHFRDGRWSRDEHLFWRGAKTGDVLELGFPVAMSGKYRLKAVLTRAPDYGIVRVLVDRRPAGGAIDLFGSKVTNTEELTLAELELSAGDHILGVEMLGANPSAQPRRMFGLDYLRLEPIP